MMFRRATVLVVGVLFASTLMLVLAPSASAQESCAGGISCDNALFVGNGEVVSELPLKPANTSDTVAAGGSGGPNGGQCYEKTAVTFYWDPVYDEDGNYSHAVQRATTTVLPCGYEVVCLSYRMDVVALPNVYVGDFLSAMERAGEDSWGLVTHWASGSSKPEVDSVIMVHYCSAYDEGVLGPIGGDQPWGETYLPSWEWVPVADEIDDLTATAEELWALIEEPEVSIGSAPPYRQTSFVRAPTWVWLEDGTEPDPVISISPSNTALLAVRATATETLWDFGESSGSQVTCTTEQLVEFNANLHDGTAPQDYGACSWTYLSTCFDDSLSVVASQCGTKDGFSVTVTITFEGEQALITRPTTDATWPEPIWEPFAATAEVTSDVFTVPVREILALNG